MKKILSYFLVLLIVTLIVLIYSRFIGTTGLETHEIAVNTDIIESFNGLKVVQFSDLHYKRIITENQVKKVIQEINHNKPDLVFFTGDLLDENYKVTNQDINFLIKELSKINAKYGSYAIMGDQDYSQEETIKNIYIQSHITLLKNDITLIYNENNDKILLGGLGSLIKNDTNMEKLLVANTTEQEMIYQIILVHEPDIIPEVLKNIPESSIILAGHSIHGSIKIPFLKKLLLPKGAKKYPKEHETIGQTKIYVSNGIGVNHINFRLFNRPAIQLYRLQRKG